MLGLRHYKGCQIDLWQGDITRFACDAMGNAANAQLAGGGGVDGAIHHAGGPTLIEECRRIGGCPIGECRGTGAGKLPAQHVLHAVGPIYQDGLHDEPALLASAYQTMFTWCESHGARHLATPAISCGVYGYPWPDAAKIAMNAIKSHLDSTPSDGSTQRQMRRVTFVLFKADLYDVFQDALFSVFPEEESP